MKNFEATTEHNTPRKNGFTKKTIALATGLLLATGSSSACSYETPESTPQPTNTPVETEAPEDIEGSAAWLFNQYKDHSIEDVVGDIEEKKDSVKIPIDLSGEALAVKILKSTETWMNAGCENGMDLFYTEVFSTKFDGKVGHDFYREIANEFDTIFSEELIDNNGGDPSTIEFRNRMIQSNTSTMHFCGISSATEKDGKYYEPSKNKEPYRRWFELDKEVPVVEARDGENNTVLSFGLIELDNSDLNIAKEKRHENSSFTEPTKGNTTITLTPRGDSFVIKRLS